MRGFEEIKNDTISAVSNVLHCDFVVRNNHIFHDETGLHIVIYEDDTVHVQHLDPLLEGKDVEYFVGVNQLQDRLQLSLFN